jgi:hypothetical protein
MKNFNLEIEYIDGFLYIQSNQETTPTLYDAISPEDVSCAVEKHINNLI